VRAQDAAGERQRCPGLAEEETAGVHGWRAHIEGHGGPWRSMGRRGQGEGRGHAGDRR